MIKFLIEPINDKDCRIIDVDCSALGGAALSEVTVPATVEHNGKVYKVKEVGKQVLFTNKYDENVAKYASLKRLKKIVFEEGIEAIYGVMDASQYTYVMKSPSTLPTTHSYRTTNAEERGNGETLTEVILPSTLKVIGASSFSDCRNLENINIPDGVEEIGAKAFYFCEHLPLFQWPKSLKKVGRIAFWNMLAPMDDQDKSTFELVIPDSIEEIHASIYNCSIAKCIVSAKGFEVLDNINIEDKENIYSCFSNRPQIVTCMIRSIDIPEGVKRISAPFGGLEHVTLPSTLEEIGPDAFRNSHVLGFLKELPEAVKKIGDRAFKDSRKDLEVVTLRLPSNPEIEVGCDAFNTISRFSNDPEVEGVRLECDEATLKSIMGQTGALNGTLIESIEISEGVTTPINISGCALLKSINIPHGVIEVIEIKDCPRLKSLTISDSVTKIEELSSLPQLTDLKLSSNLERIGIIRKCDSLTSLNLPDSLKSIGFKKDRAYRAGFENLKAEIKASPQVWKVICATEYALQGYNPANGELTIPVGVAYLAKELLRNAKIKSLVIPSTVTEFGEGVLNNCENLKNLTLPEGIASIPKCLMQSSGITSILIPCSVTEIGEFAFSECSSLETITFAEGSKLQEIKNDALSKTALKEIVFPQGMEKLCSNAIKDAGALETVVFPSSMEDYGFTADWRETKTSFVRCKSLKQFIFLADDPAIAVYPVALGKLADWYVPDSMVDFVKSFVEKAKKDYPNVKGVGAKSVKPLSKLKGYVLPVTSKKVKQAESKDIKATEPVISQASAEGVKNKAPKKKEIALTQNIKLETNGIDVVYRFAVDPSDINMLENDLDSTVLAMRYLRDKSKDCSLEFIDPWTHGRSWTVNELMLITNVNSASDNKWHCTPKSTIDMDFGNTENLPMDFPVGLLQELATEGGFPNLFKSRYPNFNRNLPEAAPAYLEISFRATILFDFMIGEKEKFNINKIAVMRGWEKQAETNHCWRFCLMYNGRYIPASSLRVNKGPYHFTVTVYTDRNVEGDIMYSTEYDGVEYKCNECEEIKLPFINDIISLVNSK